MRRSHLATLFAIAVVYLSGYLLLDRWEDMFYYGDTNGYYLHVVSFFVHDDVGDYGKSIGSLQEVNPDSPDPREDKFGIRLTEKGRRYIKYTLGVAVMESPFFLLAHAYATASPLYEANGWTKPYTFTVGLSTIVYVLIGFFLLLQVLRRYFSERVSLLTVLAVALATNLFYQSTYVTMSHGFLFFDYCLLLWLSERFYDAPRRWKALAIGGVVGLIALTRVPEVISLLIPVLWGVGSWKAFRERLQFFFLQRYDSLIAAAIGLLAVFSLQFYYWYYVSGQLVFNPYDGEGFNFLRPMIHKGWFDFNNGWLVYTPVMGLSLIGLFFLPRYASGKLLPIALFVFLQAYIHYSYYVWNYFPGLGSRPMVETYPALSLGLAACLATMMRRNWSIVLMAALLLFFTWLNLFQTWQMKKGIIWTERSNQAFYFETFGRLSPSRPALLAYDLHEMQPDSSALKKVKTIWQEGFESSTLADTSSLVVSSGERALFLQKGDLTIKDSLLLSEVPAGDWLRISLDSYMPGQYRIWDRDYCANLGLTFYDAAGQGRKYRYLKMSSYVGNPDYNIWSAGDVNQWGRTHFFTQVPERVKPGGHLKVFIANNYYGQKLYIDNLRIDHYTER